MMVRFRASSRKRKDLSSHSKIPIKGCRSVRQACIETVPRSTAHLALLVASLFGAGCDSPVAFSPSDYTTTTDTDGLTAVVQGTDTVLTVTALKWSGGAHAAISLTYDAPWGTHDNHHLATDAVIERGLRLDLELVSWIFAKPEMHHWIDLYKRDLMPHGIRFFGHGHTHALHDTMDFEAAYDSFSTNFRLMREWGLEPKAYAYPGSSGKRRSTQAANRLAGFICARGSTLQREDYFIAPGELAEPDNWYFLPSVIMGNASFQYIDVHEKLVPILDEAVERTAWIILMYHAIGIPEGWSYYPIKDFLRDLDAIIARDFWSANMDAAACYLAERASVRFSITDISGTRDATVLQVHVDDQLPDNIYDQPLTIMVRSKYAVGALEGALISVQHIDDTRVTAEVLPDGSTFTVQVLNRSI